MKKWSIAILWLPVGAPAFILGMCSGLLVSAWKAGWHYMKTAIDEVRE